MVIYYCGGILDQWSFEGFLVLSRTTELNPSEESIVQEILIELDFPADKVC